MYTIIPEGAELNATKDELYNLISIYNNTSFVSKAYKPDGTQFTKEEMCSFLKEHLTITIDTNYQDTGKTWIGFKEDFGDITFDTYDTAGSYAYFPIQYNIPIKVPYESYSAEIHLLLKPLPSIPCQAPTQSQDYEAIQEPSV